VFDLGKIGPSFYHLDNRAIDNAVQPFHEGAIRYYKENGLWSAKMEAKQKALLAQ